MTRNVRPLGEDKTEVGASLGGPLLNLGVPIAVPQTSLYVRHGLSNKWDVDVGLTLPVTSVIGIDVGTAYQIWGQAGNAPAFSLGARLYGFGNGRGFVGMKNTDGEKFRVEPKAFEDFSAVFSWAFGDKYLVWTGAQAFMQIEHMMIRPAVLAGANWRFADDFTVGMELKYVDFLRSQEFSPVSVYGIAHHGAFGVQFGLAWNLGKSDPGESDE